MPKFLNIFSKAASPASNMSSEITKRALVDILEDLKQGRLRLAEEKAKDEAILASIGEGLMVVDEAGKIIIVNRVAEELLGFEAKDLVGKFHTDVHNIEDEKGNTVAEKEEPMTKVLKTGKTDTINTYYFVRKDKKRFPVSITVSPVFLDSTIKGAIVVFRDITKEKEIEKLRMDFLSLASHQLRTPLSGTKWLIETMQRGITGKISKKQKEYLDRIYSLNERMIKLVHDMLSTLRLESGSVEIKKEDVVVSGLYKELISEMSSAANAKGVTLEVSIGGDAKLVVNTDRELLKLIIDCFVSNAINYSSGKEVILDVKEENGAVLFSVKDSGIGIPKEEQARIFERFYRTSNAKMAKPEGTGLGLYIAKLLADKLGGSVSFESELNKGSTFYLNLPQKSI